MATGGMICHIQANEGNWEEPITFVIALCGAACTIPDSGVPNPPEFDFVAPRNWMRADCARCRATHVRNRSAKQREAV